MNVSPIRVLPPATNASPAAPASSPTALSPAAPRELGAARPASSPPGATLWELLTPEERAFFAEQKTLGAATYSSSSATPAGAPAPLGQRIDVCG